MLVTMLVRAVSGRLYEIASNYDLISRGMLARADVWKIIFREFFHDLSLPQRNSSRRAPKRAICRRPSRSLTIVLTRKKRGWTLSPSNSCTLGLIRNVLRVLVVSFPCFRAGGSLFLCSEVAGKNVDDEDVFRSILVECKKCSQNFAGEIWLN